MRVINLGWGVQSFALAAMSALGELPAVDVAIHADTGHERAATSEFAERWTPWLEKRGVRVVTVQASHAVRHVMFDQSNGQTMIPLYTLSEANGARGMLRRSCTHRWKIQPIRRWLQAHRDGQQVEQWFGITLDEVQRMKPSDVQYIAHVYPFIEMLDRPWTRGMVVKWLHENDLETPVKSACVFCPYHDRAAWRTIKLGGGGDWRRALAQDEAIRNKRPGYLCYLSQEQQPLAGVDFSNEQDHGQLSLWGDECDGYCGL